MKSYPVVIRCLLRARIAVITIYLFYSRDFIKNKMNNELINTKEEQVINIVSVIFSVEVHILTYILTTP